MSDNLKVNFSDEEATSEARTFAPVSPGWYKCAITKVEDASVQSNEKGNFGKPMWNVTFVVQSGPFAKRNFWSSIMLWNGALFAASQLLKAAGFGDLVKKNTIPQGEVLLGKVIEVQVNRAHNKKEENALREVGINESVYKNEVKGYRAVQAASDSSSSLMP